MLNSAAAAAASVDENPGAPARAVAHFFTPNVQLRKRQQQQAEECASTPSHQSSGSGLCASHAQHSADNALAVDATPSDPTNNGQYPHFCPICMLHFKRILSTQCCTNTICEVCAKEMIEKATAAAPLNAILQRHASHRDRSEKRLCLADESGVYTPVTAVPCPFCSRTLKLRRVCPGTQAVRSYKDSPAVTAAAAASAAGCRSPPPPFAGLRPGSAAAETGGVGGALRQGSAACGKPSPARPGDAFEALRRKVQPLGDATNAIRALHDLRRRDEQATGSAGALARGGERHRPIIVPRSTASGGGPGGGALRRAADMPPLPGAPQRRGEGPGGGGAGAVRGAAAGGGGGGGGGATAGVASAARRGSGGGGAARRGGGRSEGTTRGEDAGPGSARGPRTPLNPIPERAASPPFRCSLM